jgi:hypothetical protein
MHELLAKDGMLAGLFFNRTFEAGPLLAEANKNMSYF